MIDIDGLEQQALKAGPSDCIQVGREELLVLINRYRELPDLARDEQSPYPEIPGAKPELPSGTPELIAHRLRTCEKQLFKAKQAMERTRLDASLFVECPDCGTRPGDVCRFGPHSARVSAAHQRLHQLKGSIAGETP